MPIGNSLRHYTFTAGHCARLLAVDAFTESGRTRFRRVSDLFGWRTWKGALESVSPASVIPPETEASICQLQELSYNVNALELGLLCQLTRVRRPRAIFEFGTFDGRSTINLALNAPEAQITTLDLPLEQASLPGGARTGQRFASHPAASRIRQVLANSLTCDFSGFAGQFDFVFIDAGHSYENCSSDTRNAFGILRSEGPAAIVWHDYTRFEGVNRAVDEAVPSAEGRGRFLHLEGTTLALYLRES